MTDASLKDIRIYTRDEKGAPTGIIIALPSKITGHKYHIGWSKCHTKVDKFVKEEAVFKAVKRIEGAEAAGKEVIETKMPHQIRKLLPAFQARCKRYFK